MPENVVHVREKKGSCGDSCDIVPKEVTLDVVEEPERKKMS